MLWIEVIVAIIGISANLLILYFNKKVEFGVKHHYDEHLEKFKHDLSQISKKIEHDFIFRNQDFALWTTKRHEAYAKIYAFLNTTLNLLYNGIDIHEYVIRLQYVNKDLTEEKLREEIRTSETEKMRDINIACDNIRLLFLEYQLYFSNEISKKLEELLGNINLFNCSYMLGFLENRPSREELTQTCKNLFIEIAQMMKRELSGDYKFTSINGEL